MFRVELRQKDHYWNKFAFTFETLDEAQQFVQSAMSHFVKGEDGDDMIIYIEFKQKYTTAKEKEEDKE